MIPENRIEVDHDLHDTLVALVIEHGAQPIEWLTPRARRERRDARVDETATIRVVEASTVLVPTVDGRITWLGDVLDGIVLTQRVRAPLAGRTDLWCGLSMQPLLNVAAFALLPLASGEEVTRLRSGEDVLVGPVGWLPDVPRFGLVGLRWAEGRLSAEPVADEALPGAAEVQAVRAMIAGHYRRERWWRAEEDLESRPGELVRAVTVAKMEDPQLFATPYPPLDEMLYHPLQQDVDEHHWRAFAAAHQNESVSRNLGDIPAALNSELEARARVYGMSFDQFVIAMLGHLAWRTPFAEDVEPYEFWDPERAGKADLKVLRSDVQNEDR
jgi:hypothetical protein